MEKKEARRTVRRRIEALTPGARVRKSEAISARLLSLPEIADADAVMAFLSMADEVDTRPMIEALLEMRKRVYVPRTFTAERRMIPIRLIGFGDVKAGQCGVMEPDTDETCQPGDLDLIIAPARAFDRRGNRLGRGSGFYDRFMAQPGFRAARCGVAFACQVFSVLPCDAHDLPVQILLTEDEALRFDVRQKNPAGE